MLRTTAIIPKSASLKRNMNTMHLKTRAHSRTIEKGTAKIHGATIDGTNAWCCLDKGVRGVGREAMACWNTPPAPALHLYLPCPPDFVYKKRGGGLLALRPPPPKKILTQTLAEGKSNLNKRPLCGTHPDLPPFGINSL